MVQISMSGDMVVFAVFSVISNKPYTTSGATVKVVKRLCESFYCTVCSIFTLYATVKPHFKKYIVGWPPNIYAVHIPPCDNI